MITIFNRKQLLLTYDLNIQAKIRNILAENNIDYVLNPIMNTWSLRGPEYKFYVHRNDFEQAEWLIRDVFKNA